MANALYEALKASPLAKLGTTTEEAAIWLDINATGSDWLLNAVIAIEERYHSNDDHRVPLDITALHFNKIMRNSLYGISSSPYLYSHMSEQSLLHPFFSTAILKSLFKVISETDALDKQASSESFMFYVEEAKHFHKKMPSTSKRDVDLYEVFAELDDILKAKFTKKCQFPLS